MDSKPVSGFPAQKAESHHHNREFTCQNSVEISADAKNRNENQNGENADHITGEILEKDERSPAESV